MTAIMNFSSSLFPSDPRDNSLKEYQVEVVNYDGEVERVHVEARNENEASDEAASMVPNADYTMVYLIGD